MLFPPFILTLLYIPINPGLLFTAPTVANAVDSVIFIWYCYCLGYIYISQHHSLFHFHFFHRTKLQKRNFIKVIIIGLFKLSKKFLKALHSFSNRVDISIYVYRTRAIITRGLYTFYPILEGQKRLRSFFCKILTLCTISIQERVMKARVQ